MVRDGQYRRQYPCAVYRVRDALTRYVGHQSVIDLLNPIGRKVGARCDGKGDRNRDFHHTVKIDIYGSYTRATGVRLSDRLRRVAYSRYAGRLGTEDGFAYVSVRTPFNNAVNACLLYTSPSPRDRTRSRMPSSA